MVEKIQGGYYIKARRIRDSDIAHAPPHVREIWDYFIREASHQGMKKRGLLLKRGQLLVNYDDIREALHWKVGWRKQYYTRAQCETAMKFLRGNMPDKTRRTATKATRRTTGKTTRITTTKTGRGIVVTILNYDFYQNLENYENHTQPPHENHNENHKENRTENHTRPIKNPAEKQLRFEGEEDPPEATRGPPPCPVKRIVSLYHTILPELPKCRAVEGVATNIKSRWREKKVRQNLEWWTSLFENRIRTSDFLMGRKTDWNANLQWIVGPVNLAKILNGQYENKGNGAGPAPQTYGQHLDDERRRKVRMLMELDDEQPEAQPESRVKRIDAP